MHRHNFRRMGFVVVAGLCLLYGAVSVGAETKDKAQPEIEEKAMSIAMGMANFISKSNNLSVTADMGYDAVQDSGQKIEFGSTARITIGRPDHLRAEAEQRDGTKYGMVLDGKNIWAYNLEDNVYATATQPGNTDQSLSYVKHELKAPIPLSDLFSSDLPRVIRQEANSVRYVEEAKIAGVPCDHIAIRTGDMDMQFWIAKGNQPLPRRMVLTYNNVAGQPQFWAQFSDWNLSPKISDSLFAFSPAEGAERIPFAPQLQETIREQ